MNILRAYKDEDYDQLKELYLHKEWYGGVFDEARDSREVLAKKIIQDPEAILVYEKEGRIVGTISLIEDGRVAWLYRFVVKDLDTEITDELYEAITKTLKERGHSEVLVYSPTGNSGLDQRYVELNMLKGGDYSCFYKAL